MLLDRAEGTPFADYPAAFVRRLVEHAERALAGTPAPVHRDILELVVDNTRRAIAQILATGRDREHARALIDGFWGYQLPGLDGLMASIEPDLAAADDARRLVSGQMVSRVRVPLRGRSERPSPRLRNRPDIRLLLYKLPAWGCSTTRSS